MRKVQRYGWQPDLPDHRDHMFGSRFVRLPARVDLTPKMPPVFDQGQLGSCTSQALAAALAFEHGGGPYSRLQIYYDERVIERSVGFDNGAQIRDGVKVLAKKGGGLEKLWPYRVANFKKAPPAAERASAVKIAEYQRLNTSADFHACLAAGFPFVIGFTVYGAFESDVVARTGIVPMPSGSVVGGHAVCVVGYDDRKRVYIVRNSWGYDWGMAGNFTIPQAYFNDRNLADDAWTLRK